MNCRVKIKTLLSRRRFLHMLTDAVDDVSNSIDVAKDATECFPDLAQIRGLQVGFLRAAQAAGGLALVKPGQPSAARLLRRGAG